MLNISDRISDYEHALDLTLSGFEKSIKKDSSKKDKKSLENLGRHIENIKKFGVKDYYAISKLTTINFFADNYKQMSPKLFDDYLKSFGVEKNDTLYFIIRSENNKDTVRNILWRDCLGMDYDLISKSEALTKQEEIFNDNTLSANDKQREYLSIVCLSGYSGKKYTNPLYGNNFELIFDVLCDIRKGKNKIR